MVALAQVIQLVEVSIVDSHVKKQHYGRSGQFDTSGFNGYARRILHI